MERDISFGQNRMPVELATSGFSKMAIGVLLFQQMEG